MKRFVSTAILWVSVFVPMVALSAPVPIDFTKDSGEIQGSVDYCGPSGSEGIEVSIPGKSFMARTNNNGEFTLSYVPEGVWDLVFLRKGQRLGRLSAIDGLGPVEVLRRSLTDLDNIHGPITLCADSDGDGYTPDEDCNDANITVYPGAPEFCGNGLDDNCNNEIDETCPNCTDSDEDGFFAQFGCGIVDCDDANVAISPGAPEICGDGVDNDCDGLADEADAYDAVNYYVDFDGDGYGDENDLTPITACNQPEGYAPLNNDCADDNSNVYPGQIELCNNGVNDNCDSLTDTQDINCSNRVCTDQDVYNFEACLNECLFAGGSFLTCGQTCALQSTEQCGPAVIQLAVCSLGAGCLDGVSDEACVYGNCPEEWEAVFGNYIPTECTTGDTRSCGITDIGECQLGTQSCVSGLWAECSGNIDPVEEICEDGIDNDCNGVADDCSLACDVGFDDCNGIDEDGCEVDLSTDSQNCGACGQVCGTDQVCLNGSCALSCTGNSLDCGTGSCVDISSDDQNCGACGQVCGTDQVCLNGSCALSCTGNSLDCGTGSCVDISIDPNNCGACGQVCDSGQVCWFGTCDNTCNTNNGPFGLSNHPDCPNMTDICTDIGDPIVGMCL